MQDGTRIITLGEPKVKEVEITALIIKTDNKVNSTIDTSKNNGSSFEEAFGLHTIKPTNCPEFSNAVGLAPVGGYVAPSTPSVASKLGYSSAPVTPIAPTPAVKAQLQTLLTQVQQANLAAQNALQNAKKAQSGLPPKTDPNAKAIIASAKQTTANANAESFKQATIARNATNQMLTLVGKPTLPPIKAPTKIANKILSYNTTQSKNLSNLTLQKIQPIQQSKPAPGTVPASRFDGNYSNASGTPDKVSNMIVKVGDVLFPIAIVVVGYIIYKEYKKSK